MHTTSSLRPLAVVTGVSSGIGRELAGRLAAGRTLTGDVARAGS